MSRVVHPCLSNENQRTSTSKRHALLLISPSSPSLLRDAAHGHPIQCHISTPIAAAAAPLPDAARQDGARVRAQNVAVLSLHSEHRVARAGCRRRRGVALRIAFRPGGPERRRRRGGRLWRLPQRLQRSWVVRHEHQGVLVPRRLWIVHRRRAVQVSRLLAADVPCRSFPRRHSRRFQ